ncbi:cysteine hydrolase family protein [Glutamicibacter uratoxydans]|nr:cysteine hydrolase family protein [Glutamicibacter uratoxydans]
MTFTPLSPSRQSIDDEGMKPKSQRIALVVIDVQNTFDNHAYWGTRDNPSAEANIDLLVKHWTDIGQPIVMVTHTSSNPESSFYPEHQSAQLKPFLRGVVSAVHITKTVNSAFLGTPDLAQWLHMEEISELVICGIQTNMCVETTTRMAGNLGFSTKVALDACHTFDLLGPAGRRFSAEQLSAVTAANLYGGGFADIVQTQELLAAATEENLGGLPSLR